IIAGVAWVRASSPMKLMVRSGPMVMRLTREAPGRRPGFMGLLSFEGTRIEIGCRRSRKACQDAAWCENLSEIALTAKQTPLIPAPAFAGMNSSGNPGAISAFTRVFDALWTGSPLSRGRAEESILGCCGTNAASSEDNRGRTIEVLRIRH